MKRMKTKIKRGSGDIEQQLYDMARQTPLIPAGMSDAETERLKAVMQAVAARHKRRVYGRIWLKYAALIMALCMVGALWYRYFATEPQAVAIKPERKAPQHAVPLNVRSLPQLRETSFAREDTAYYRKANVTYHIDPMQTCRIRLNDVVL